MTPTDTDAGFNLDGNPDSPAGHAANLSDADPGENGHEEMMQAFGITRGSEKGSLVFNSSAIERLHRVLTQPSTP